MGIEPTSVAWEATVLPLDDTRAKLGVYAQAGLVQLGEGAVIPKLDNK